MERHIPNPESTRKAAGIRQLAVRVLLVAGFVGVAHLFDWWWLRVLTTATLVKISAMLGVPMPRLGPDTILVAGIAAKFVVSCTMIDAFFGAVPLLWRRRDSWVGNLLRLAAVFGGISVLNIFRLEAGFLAMTRGVPWWLAHECVSGVTYFCFLLFILRERARLGLDVGDAPHPRPGLYPTPAF